MADFYQSNLCNPSTPQELSYPHQDKTKDVKKMTKPNIRRRFMVNLSRKIDKMSHLSVQNICFNNYNHLKEDLENSQQPSRKYATKVNELCKSVEVSLKNSSLSNGFFGRAKLDKQLLIAEQNKTKQEVGVSKTTVHSHLKPYFVKKIKDSKRVCASTVQAAKSTKRRLGKKMLKECRYLGEGTASLASVPWIINSTQWHQGATFTPSCRPA